MGETIYAIAILVIALVGTPLIVWKMGGSFAERGEEDAARDFYVEHGRWPDQTPEEAEAEREAMRSAPLPPDQVADDDGRL